MKSTTAIPAARGLTQAQPALRPGDWTGSGAAEALLKLASFKRWTLRKDLANARAGRRGIVGWTPFEKGVSLGCQVVRLRPGGFKLRVTCIRLAAKRAIRFRGTFMSTGARRTAKPGSIRKSCRQAAGAGGCQAGREVMAVRRSCETCGPPGVFSTPGRFRRWRRHPAINNSHIVPVGRQNSVI